MIKTQKKTIMSMNSTLKFGRYKGSTIQQMLDERDHECVHYLLWLQSELNITYTPEVQKELLWQDQYVPKQSYNKHTYWGYTYTFK
jgi:hypothetical protein